MDAFPATNSRRKHHRHTTQLHHRATGRYRRCLLPLLYLLPFLLPFAVTAQDNTYIQGDRPDQTDGASLLHKQEFQVEQEFYYNHFREGAPAYITSTLVRYGLFSRLETRLLVEDGKERDKFVEKTTQGLYPLAFSFKLALLKDHRILPDITLVHYLQLPLTSRTGEDRYWSPCFLLALEKELGNFTVTTNTGIKWEAFEPSHSWQATADVKYELSRRTEVYAEYFAHYSSQQHPLHNADVGILYHLSPRWMISLAGGSTLFSHEPNRFLTTGIAFRLPHT
jgi:hypothetical protein